MANNETKTNAELYREQRKARLAKAAKKKNHGKNDKVIGILVKVVCILLVAAIVLYFVGSTLTNVFCVPQKVLTAATYGDYKLTVAEYNYFYMSLYNQAANTAQQYDQYYSGMGAQYFDVSVDPAEQDCQETDLPEGVVTWADYFAYCAPERGFFVKSLYDKAMSEDAKKAGFKVSDEETKTMKTSIDEQMTFYREKATAEDYALDNYLFKTFGEGVTEKLYRELLEKEYVAELYLAWYQENATGNVTDEQIEKYYADNKADIDVATIRVFGVSYAEVAKDSEDPQLSKEDAEARCKEFIAKLEEGGKFTELAKEFAVPSQKKDYEDESTSLMKYQTKSALEGIDEKLGDWAFAAERKANDTYILHLDKSEAYFVVMLETPATKNTTPTSVDVRHILIEVKTTTTSDSGNEVDLPQETIDQNKKAALEKAEKVVKEWEEKGKTEEAFIELVGTNSNDQGSLTTGGLYEDINSSSSYVAPFLDWALAEHKTGDYGIVETTYGYHIMYYVGGDTTPKWESDVRSTLGTHAYEDYYFGLEKQIKEGVKRNDGICKFFTKRTEEIIDRLVKMNTSSYSYM